MSHIFSSNRPSHLHPPAPPSSFSRSSSAVRNSLRKIPSSLFAKSDNASLKPKHEKLSIFEDSARVGSIQVGHPRPLFGSPRREKEQPKEKSKGKTRKALAEILHWGNAITNSPPKPRLIEKPRQASAPIHARHIAPTPPAKDAESIKTIEVPSTRASPSAMPIHTPAVLRKRSSRQLTTQSSRSGLSALASTLRGKPSVQDVKSRARPSMAPDPFERGGEGAEVVDVPPLRVGSVSSASTGLDRRGSIASRKALSTKTVDSEKGSCKTLPEKPTVSAAIATLPIETLLEPHSTVQQKHTSVPLPIRAPLTDLPTRNASLGRVLGAAAIKQDAPPPSSFRGHPQPTYRTEDVSQRHREAEIKARPVLSPCSVTVGLPVIEEKQEERGLRKEKTKSKVWSIFRGKKDRTSEVPSVSSCRSSATQEPIAERPRRKESLRKPVPLLEPAESIAVRSSSLHPRQEPPKISIRPRPPALHLTKPSVDGNLHAELSGSTISSPPFSNLIPKTAKTGTSSPPSSPLARSFDSPSRLATMSGQGGVWESVAGSIAERPSIDGPRTVMTISRKPVPKRKSLTGLFGLAMKKSFDRIKPDAPPSAFTLGNKEGKVASGTLRSLAEEMEDADPGIARNRHSSPPFSVRDTRRDSALLSADADLSHVASATDMLLDLVERFDFSPAPTLGLSPSPASTIEHPSFTSVDADGSPTPMRRIRSAVLTSKKSKDSPMRPGTNISPLKLALHRNQLAQQQGSKGKKTRPVSSPAASPPRMSMVKKGMRNIFAPPSPPKPLPARPTVLRPFNENVMMATKAVVMEKEEPSATQVKAKADRRFSGTNQLGLPLPPPEDRISPRRCAQGPPTLSLPPVPDALTGTEMSTGPTHLGFDLSAPVDPRASVASDLLSPDIAMDNRNSFDFTGEYASLDQGDKRYSFVEALAKVKSSEVLRLPTLPPVPPIPSHVLEPLPEDRSFRVEPQRVEEESTSEEEDDLDEACMVLPQLAYSAQSHSPQSSRESKSSKSSTSTARRSPRPPPFQGNPAFRMRVSQLKESMTPPASLASEGPRPSTLDHRPSLTALTAMVDGLHSRNDSLDLPEVPTTDHSRNASLEPPRPAYMSHAGTHGRAESGISIATMSSLGAVIETGIAGEYTNYFEVNFTKHLQENGQAHSRGPSTSSIPVPSRRVSRDSISRPPKRHHRRNSSIVSIDSIPGVEVPGVPHGPPVSMYNPRRSHISYVSRHRRGMSGEGSFGRPDWAAHRRNSSSADSSRSYVSTTSISRLGRPGLGEKMFELDGGVQLTAIAASPATQDDDDEEEIEIRAPSPASSRTHQSKWSIDSLDVSRATWDSILDSSFRAIPPGAQMPNFGQSTTDEDFFGDLPPLPNFSAPQETKKDAQKGFFLQPLRPVSMVSSVHSTGEEDGSDDTCINVAKYAKHLGGPSQSVEALPALEQCFEGEGEDDTMTEAQLALSTNSNGSSRRHGTSFARPVKPRRKPAALIFKDATQPDTPVLSSPSASEASSRLSLDTKFSDGASLFSASRFRPIGAGHTRQKSSQGVTVHPTIKEEPSIATLRAQGSPATVSRAKAVNNVAKAPIKVKSWYADGEEDEDQEILQQMKKWSELRHEAEYECRRGKELWQDPRSSSFEHTLEFSPPKTVRDIMAFLAKSQATYRPMEEQPRRPAHRRKSSLKDSRAMLSPYGLPLPKPPSQIPQRPKGSLQTKFERTNSSNSATSSKFSFGPDDNATFGFGGQTPRSSTSPFAVLFPELAGETSPPRPPAAMFAQFAREMPPSPPPSLPAHQFSPFHLSPFKLSSSPVKSALAAEAGPSEGSRVTTRSRVTSSARRKALGWGRRRNSDGPVATLATSAAGQMSTLPSRSRVEVLKAERSNVPQRLPPVVYKMVNAVSPIKARGSAENTSKGSEGRSTVHSGRENVYAATRPPAKTSSRKSAKRAQSQPLALRI